MSKKYYAVAKGDNPGIYETWSECHKEINGYSDAVYKSFKSKDDAKNYINDYEKKIESSDDIEDYDIEVEKDLKNNRLVIFTDGSFNEDKENISGYGCVIITPDKEKYEISDVVHTRKYDSSNNIGPEVMGVLEGLEWALSNEYKTVTIYPDLELIVKWAKGEKKAKAKIGQLFLRELNQKYKIALDIRFKWVPGHKDVEYNERADFLASQAVNGKNCE